MLRYFLLAACSVALSLAQCPPYSVYYNGTDRCFHFNATSFNSFDSARSYCVSKGGDLASIHSDDENSFLFNYWLARYEQAPPWIGMRYTDGPNNFTWSDGTPYDYALWYRTPNTTYNMECVLMTFINPGKWNIHYCNDNGVAALCSVPKVQAGTTPRPQTTTPPSYSNCSTGYSFNGKCYNFVAIGKSWDSARSQCLIQGGDLVSIHTSAENQYLAKTARSLGFNGFWTGLNRQLDGTSNYTWSDDSTYNYNAFSPSVPGACANGAQDCVSEDTGKAQWFNCWPCTHQLPFICELNIYSVQVAAVAEKEKHDESLAQRMNLKRSLP